MSDPNKYDSEKPLNKRYGSNYRPGDYRERPGAYREEETSIIPNARAPKPVYEPKHIDEKIVISSRMIQGLQDEPIKPLRLVSEDVIGGIFDRVVFLRSRIDELNSNIIMRKQIHDSITKEIEKDIEDRDSFMRMVSDINEKRNLKLDISVLRKERRHEDVQFWRDLVELNAELRKMQEEFDIESKIASIFSGMEK